MFGLLRSAINYLLQFLLQGGIVKFVLFSGLYFVITVLGGALKSKLSDLGLDGIGSMFSGLPSDVLFFMGVFRLEIGLPMIIAAYVLRFAIRRIPIIG